ncbi:nitroreductase/quinone reductase family protein [Gordonia shandongensis]|uniref:nitroreductase/quinone reductase family protein n=1 Tax=Gordonia shandongensis TaxID=376351 RepID=UPI0003F699A6|nr:nitroreductase/quinone reductase family protein [Gordonia shandongensis]
MGLLTPIAVRIGAIDSLPTFLPVILAIDGALRFVTRGRVGLLRLAGLPGVTMVIPGRRSGVLRRTTVLAARDGPDWIVAGSFFGGQRAPAWVFNLRDAEVIAVEVNGRSRQMRRRELVDRDRREAWDRLLAVWPNFAVYARRTERVIPVFRLSPAGADGADG